MLNKIYYISGIIGVAMAIGIGCYFILSLLLIVLQRFIGFEHGHGEVFFTEIFPWIFLQLKDTILIYIGVRFQKDLHGPRGQFFNTTLHLYFHNNSRYNQINIFTKHPLSVGESYIQHMMKALQFSVIFFMLCIIAFIHALFPFWFVSTASIWIHNINDKMQERK